MRGQTPLSSEERLHFGAAVSVRAEYERSTMNRHSRARFYRELDAYLAFWTEVLA
jgi:hypothetical protein